MIKKYISLCKEFSCLLQNKKATLKIIISFSIVVLLFLLPYLLLLTNVFNVFGIVTYLPKVLIIFFPVYFQVCSGLFTKYFYQMCDDDIKNGSILNAHKSFLVGFLFIPTFIFMVFAAIIMLILWGMYDYYFWFINNISACFIWSSK